jgi:hypothetical protein
LLVESSTLLVEGMTTAGRWFIGLLVGGIVGVGAIVGGVVAASLGFIAVILLAARPTRAAPVGGLCLGLGGAWLALLVRAEAACTIDCVGPSVTWWYAVSGAALLLGVTLSVQAARAARRDG